MGFVICKCQTPVVSLYYVIYIKINLDMGSIYFI